MNMNEQFQNLQDIAASELANLQDSIQSDVQDIRRQHRDTPNARIQKPKPIDPEIWVPMQVICEHELSGHYKQLGGLAHVMCQLYFNHFFNYAKRFTQYRPMFERLNASIMQHKANPNSTIIQAASPDHLPKIGILFTGAMKMGFLRKGVSINNRNYWDVAAFPMECRKKWLYPLFNEISPDFVKYCMSKKIRIMISEDMHVAVPQSVLDHFDLGVVTDEKTFVEVSNFTLTTY